MQQAYAQNKGTLTPGQFITVNEHTIQVERYLSQGGFAHVYLVRTTNPVLNTTHHVLKRIAATNDSALAEVKKEVDVMRILKGHPNIVQLIDAAYYKMATGAYEVFILMEYCPGGGIIDMMNRRLRERLTESEILQIFVDVCEGVAAMHNLRPPLLHRDLKVENILQSTSTIYKLCDFGSATAAATRPPSTIQEIRMVEADLNRHTTLQYRAPEMIGPYLRRPIDEKSDVWALGVLLYKLCYYTTPFEEHGPLAILSVNYRIPPYPVYSRQMNGLIESMLKEHGAQRPHVFEILESVHLLRGTKSSYSYTIPTPAPLSPRALHLPNALSVANDARTAVAPSSIAAKISSESTDTQAREPASGITFHTRKPDASSLTMTKPVLRSSRSSPGTTPTVQVSKWPEPSQTTREPNITRTPETTDPKIPLTGDPDWNLNTKSARVTLQGDLYGDAWVIRGKEDNSIKNSPTKAKLPLPGFGDQFTPQKAIDAGIDFSSVVTSSSSGKTAPFAARPPNIKSNESSRIVMPTSRDVFDGLGLSVPTKIPAPTLGEARKLRTGLAVVHGRNFGPLSMSSRSNSPGSAAPMLMPSPTPSSPYRPSSSSSRTTQTASKLSISQDHLPVEARFPSLEELDATFAPPVKDHPSPLHARTIDPSSVAVPPSNRPVSSSTPRYSSNFNGGVRPLPVPPVGNSMARADKETSAAVRGSPGTGPSKPSVDSLILPTPLRESGSHSPKSMKPILPQIRRSSNGPKQTSQPGTASVAKPSHPPASDDLEKHAAHMHDAKRAPVVSEGDSMAYTAYLRGSPERRAAHEQSNLTHTPQEATTVLQQSPQPTDSVRASRTQAAVPKPSRTSLPGKPLTSVVGHRTRERSVSRRSPSPRKSGGGYSSSSVDEGPEEPIGYIPPGKTIKRQGKKSRQNSVHDLVDLWGGSAAQSGEKEARHVTGKNASVKPPPSSPIKRSQPSPIFPKSNSPQKLSVIESPHARPKQSPKGAAHHEDTRTSDPGSPIRSARPQSMFLFPVSKSLSEDRPSEPPSSSSVFSPPAELKSRVSRRTSISDMVQHYETIEGRVKGQQSPAVVASSVALTLGTPNVSNRENDRDSRMRVPSSPLAPKIDALTRPFPPVIEKGAGELAKPGLSSTGTPNTVRLEGPGRGANIGPPIAPRRSTTTENQNSSAIKLSPVRKTSEDRPPSPDKPYQGVGKLITQWEGKTAEADPSKAQLRRKAGFVPKRT